MDIVFNLEADMSVNPEVISYVKDDEVARAFYSALCNMRWRKINALSSEEHVIQRLKGEEPDVWSCSWRYAGGIIADIRNKHYNTNEDYMTFYCSGNEGSYTDLVEECFRKMGWEPYPWDDILDI